MAKHIDTLDVQLSLRGEVRENIKSKLSLSPTEEGAYEGSPAYLPYSFFYRCRGFYLIVTVEHEAMIGIETVEKLQEEVIKVVTDFFHITTEDIVKYKVVKTPTTKARVRCDTGKTIVRKIGKSSIHQDLVEINRIEYKNDFRLKVDEEKLVIMDILRILADRSNKCEKGKWIYSNRINCTYSSDRNNYVSITCYFKEYERLEKGDTTGATRYKNIFRTEVKVKNKHLNYQKKHRDKTLARYFNIKVAQEYFQKYIEPIFYTEPFYRLDVAIDKITNAENLKEFQKVRLSAFITRINGVGITKAKDEHDIDTVTEYINRLRELHINPLCFSPIIDGTTIGIEKLDNFTLFENSISEDI